MAGGPHDSRCDGITLTHSGFGPAFISQTNNLTRVVCRLTIMHTSYLILKLTLDNLFFVIKRIKIMISARSLEKVPKCRKVVSK